MTQTIEQLQARVAELEAENARLKVMEESALKVCGQLDEVVIALPYDYLDPPDGGDVSLGEQVTRMYSEVKMLRHAVVIAQAEIKRLRDALRGLSFGEDWNNGTHAKIYRPQLLKLLAQPSDTSALDAYVAEKVKEYRSDVHRLTRELDVIWNGEDGAAKQASLCDVVAQLRKDVPDLRRQRDLAVEALRSGICYSVAMQKLRFLQSQKTNQH